MTKRSLQFPINFDQENDEGDQEAEEDPHVDELEVGRLRQGGRNSLVHCVHDEHDRQDENDGPLKLWLVEEEGDLDDDQQAQHREVRVGQVVEQDPLEAESDLNAGVLVVLQGRVLDVELG